MMMDRGSPSVKVGEAHFSGVDGVIAGKKFFNRLAALYRKTVAWQVGSFLR